MRYAAFIAWTLAAWNAGAAMYAWDGLTRQQRIGAAYVSVALAGIAVTLFFTK